MKSGCVLLLFLLAFTGCIPQTNTVNRVVIVNAPAEAGLKIAAPLLQDNLLSRYPTSQYQFVSKSQASFAEGHTDLFGSRALPNTSAIANRLGAEVAVMVGAPLFERDVKLKGAGAEERREISTRIQLELKLIDPLSQTVLSSYKSAIFTAYRVEPTTQTLIDIEDDQAIQDSIVSAIQDLSPQVAADLSYIFEQLSPVDSTL